jgi:hypothetical protein
MVAQDLLGNRTVGLKRLGAAVVRIRHAIVVRDNWVAFKQWEVIDFQSNMNIDIPYVVSVRGIIHHKLNFTIVPQNFNINVGSVVVFVHQTRQLFEPARLFFFSVRGNGTSHPYRDEHA